MFNANKTGHLAWLLSVGLATPAWAAAPTPPAKLMPEIQQEFARLYELPDTVLALQVEPALEIFPEYRADLVKYLAQDASPERKKILANVSKASKKEIAAWFTPKVTKALITAAVAGGAIAAITHKGGGGGGSSKPATVTDPAAGPTPGATPGTTPGPTPGTTPGPVPDPGLDASAREAFRTREYKNTMSLNAIHADYAYARGGTGQGVVISVQDVDQVNTNHPELVNQLAAGSVLGGTDGHGTAVARTAVGEKNDDNFHGVAYDAKLLTHWGVTDAQVVDREIQYGARISNHSYTVGGTAQQIANNYGAMYQRGVDAGIVYVWAAGNDKTQSEPSTFASLPLLVPGLEGHWLAVVAVDLNIDWSGNGNATASSLQGNPCGSAKAWCISAPGFGFQNPIEDFSNGISITTGSSIAAPTVSGALAILMQVFPTLSSEQIVERVLVSANKTGIYADQDIYGQGLLDLDSATRPIGALMINTQTGMTIPLSQAAIAESSVMGSAIRTSLAKVNLVVKDSLNAPFVVSASELSQGPVRQHARIKTEDYVSRLNQQYDLQHMQRGGLSLTFSEASSEGSGLASLGQVQALQQVDNNLALSATVNTDPSWNQGLLQAAPSLRNASATQAFSNPYLSQGEQASGAGLHWNLGQNWHTSVQAQLADAPEEFADRQSHARQRSVQSEWGYSHPDGFSASLQLGALDEQQRLLGSRSATLLGNGDARTLFSGLNLAVPLNRQWSLYGRYNAGQTRQHGSGWANTNNLRSDSFTLGINGQPTPQLQVGALAYQPLRLSGGSLSTSLPTGLNADNSVAWNKVNLDLSADGKHMEYELFFRYDMPVWDVNFKGSLLRIEDYNNQAGNDDAMLILSAGMKY